MNRVVAGQLRILARPVLKGGRSLDKFMPGEPYLVIEPSGTLNVDGKPANTWNILIGGQTLERHWSTIQKEPLV